MAEPASVNPPTSSDTASVAAVALTDAAASLSAAAQSLTENITKAISALSSITENVTKQSSVGSTNLSDSTVNDARTVGNDLATVYSVGHVESIRAGVAQLVSDAGEFARRSRGWVDREIAAVQDHDRDVRAVIVRSLSNAAETDNMVGKQAVRHADTQLFETAGAEAGENITSYQDVAGNLLSVAEQLQAVAASMRSSGSSSATKG